MKFNNLGLALRMSLKFYTSVAKELKIKTKEVLVVISLIVEVAGENKEKGVLLSPYPFPPHPES